MIRSYKKTELYMVITNLANLFDYAVNVEHEDLDKFYIEFSLSDEARDYENGVSSTINGISGIELYYQIKNIKDIPEYAYEYSNDGASREYWFGYILGFSQWYLNVSFIEIGNSFKASELRNKYHPYHEMDETHFTNDIYEVIKESRKNLEKFRLYYHLSKEYLNDLCKLTKDDILKESYEKLECLTRKLGLEIFDIVNNLDLKINMYYYDLKCFDEYGQRIDYNELQYFIDHLPYKSFTKYNDIYYIRREDIYSYLSFNLLKFIDKSKIEEVINKVLIPDPYEKYNGKIVKFDYMNLLDLICSKGELLDYDAL